MKKVGLLIGVLVFVFCSSVYAMRIGETIVNGVAPVAVWTDSNFLCGQYRSDLYLWGKPRPEAPVGLYSLKRPLDYGRIVTDGDFVQIDDVKDIAPSYFNEHEYNDIYVRRSINDIDLVDIIM